MKPQTRSKIHRIQAIRRERVAQLYLNRLTEVQIAEFLSGPTEQGGLGMYVSRGVVNKDLRELTKKWEANALDNIEKIRARELAELDQMEAQAAVHFTQMPHTAWLGTRLNVKARRASLMGLDAASRHELSGPNGGAIQFSVELVDLIMRDAAKPAMDDQPTEITHTITKSLGPGSTTPTDLKNTGNLKDLSKEDT